MVQRVLESISLPGIEKLFSLLGSRKQIYLHKSVSISCS